VGTFPVRVGQTFARHVDIFCIVMAYGVILYLVAAGFFSTFMLIILFAGQRALYAIYALSKPRPFGPPKGFEVFWPTWFSGFCFYHNRSFGGLFILGVLLDTLFRKVDFGLSLPINSLGWIVLGLGLVCAGIRATLNRKKTQAA